MREGGGCSSRPTLGWIREDSVASALDDRRFGGILIIVRGGSGFGGRVLRGRFRGAVSDLA